MGEAEATGAGETDPGQMPEGSVRPKETVKPDENAPKAAWQWDQTQGNKE